MELRSTRRVACGWLWGGWSVRRYTPTGALLARVALPCANVTKIAFGGSDLRTAFVTTASVGLSADERDRQPLAGGFFAFDAPEPGLPLPSVRLMSDYHVVGIGGRPACACSESRVAWSSIGGRFRHRSARSRARSGAARCISAVA